MSAEPITIRVDDTRCVSGLLQVPQRARMCYVLAHGAGAGMTHLFLTAMAEGLAERGIATLRYQFPYMEQRSKRPDVPALAQATVRAAVAHAGRLLPAMALVAGGKSFGGRMTSQAQAESPLAKVKGLVFLGFPLHPPGRPSTERGQHLFNVQVPMLFQQGTRDEFATLELLKGLVEQLGQKATLRLYQDADHSFHVPKRSGRTDLKVQTELLDAASAWMSGVSELSGHAGSATF